MIPVPEKLIFTEIWEKPSQLSQQEFDEYWPIVDSTCAQQPKGGFGEKARPNRKER